MKLRNKKTGEIGELHFEPDKEYHFTVATEDPANMRIYKTLEALCQDWEDYKEPKGIQDVYNVKDYVYIKMGSEEEAEKAVEKLKAWERLKDKGFRFDGYDIAHNGTGDLCGQVFYKAGKYSIEDIEKDLDLLFGGEE